MTDSERVDPKNTSGVANGGEQTSHLSLNPLP
jgi:hypothetical protein